MQGQALYEVGLWVLFALTPLTLLGLAFITAPYGRHARAGWGPTLTSRWGWIYMESPPVLLFSAVFWWAGPHLGVWGYALWMTHYLQRMLVYPLRMRDPRKPMPFSVASMGFSFNLINAPVNAWFLSHNTRFEWIGAVVFFIGYAINLHADEVLRRLRRPGESGYKIPVGGLYRWISCPNYFGEMIEWTGFAIAAWSPAGAAFALYTVANLGPRALQNHRWYLEKFADYPKVRRALVPFLL